MRRLWMQILNLIRFRRAEAEMEREIASHLNLLQEEFESRGIPPGAARRAARIAYGGLEGTREAHREARTMAWVANLGRDIRQAVRALRRAPAFTAAAILTLALGIGANAAIFSVVDGVLLKPLPYPRPDRLVALRQMAPGAGGISSSGDMAAGLDLSASMYFTYAEQNRTFSAVGVWIPSQANVTGVGQPEQVRSVSISDGVLPALGIGPAVGRLLETQDQQPHAGRTILLGYGYWQRRFGGDRQVVGRDLLVNDIPRQIVGVMPRGFRVADFTPDLILPLQIDRSTAKLAGFGYNGLARLRDGATLAEADADMTRMLPIWMDSFSNGPGSNGHFYERWRITPAVRRLQDDVTGNVSGVLWAVMATLGLVLLIACANVTNLFFVRAEARQQELAIRGALGAGRRRLVSALLVESAIPALAGGAFGLLFAAAALRLIQAMGITNLPRQTDIALDGRTLAFTFLLSLVCGLLAGLIPAWKYSKAEAASGLREGGRGMSSGRERMKARGFLIMAQMAMAVLLLVGAGLTIRTVAALRGVNPGFIGADQVQTFRMLIPPALIPDATEAARTREAVVERLAALPGATSAAFIDEAPMEEFGSDWDEIFTDDKTQAGGNNPPMRTYNFPSPGYFRTVGTQIVAGREFTWDDVYGKHPVVMVSQNLARQLWGSAGAALGHHVREDDAFPWAEVVGVAEDVRADGVQFPAPAIVYWPPLTKLRFDGSGAVTMVVRSSRAGTQGFMEQVEQAVAGVNANLPAANPRTLGQIESKSLALATFTMVILAIAGAMALALGVIGIYGVVAYAVAQRRREIGIRMALGARGGEVQAMFVRNGLGLAGRGAVVGLIAAGLLASGARAWLPGLQTLDPMTFAAMPMLLMGAVALACYLPARRAAAVDPMETLRAE